MSLQDQIADMLTRVRNGQERMKQEVGMPSSKLKIAVAEILQQEGYIKDYSVSEDKVKPVLTIRLKYFEGKPVIELLKRVSSPGLRRYSPTNKLPRVYGGLGTAIVSTSRGVMTDRSARQLGIGGEIICIVA
ncbi:MAG: 30S ribosomal protein S8 [Gammaproteobacteria bacterium]|nr:30S ribosomal protein S8 [Gammaproteobacteria bacterium]MCY4210116.1 30S ribosomal protein S8 [Gammaproteobacteria bacterium]MCY4282473.1 30S ribosomal protein S8 [Gammaproteobacteria bacterium]MCY4338382.1 30S ribosomal protein S8 [Gammaproteobacteria bacterium]